MRQSVRLSLDPESARRARDVVRGLLEGRAPGTRVLDTALLLTSELVVDETLLSEDEVTLDVALLDTVLRISVTGTAVDRPRGRPHELLAELATRWGVDTAASGATTTWFELAYVTPVD